MAMNARSGRARDGTAYQLTGGSGPVVALVHGLGLNRGMWREQVPCLAARFRVLTYDLAGHGESPPSGARPSLAVFSSQLSGLLDDIGIARAAVAGFSLGGMIARRFAMDHSERLWALAILHSAHRRDPAAHAAIAARVEQARARGPSATVEAALTRWFGDDFRRDHGDTMDLVRRWILENDPEIYPLNYQVLVEGVDELVAPQPPISCPTLVMTGSEDHGNSPAMSVAIAGEIAGARTVILDGLRHMAMMEAPARFNAELLAFLDDVRPGAEG
ncbi:MAG: alpha/beta fold hydrolase [Rhizobiales bacterium]|nr:alpha/beta fold hydrolase [Hyphomicrobiales bacterium]